MTHRNYTAYEDEKIPAGRVDYGRAAERLTYFAKAYPGAWILVAKAATRSPAKNLQRAARGLCLNVEVVTRPMRPNSDNPRPGYEIWARVAPRQEGQRNG